MNMPQEYQARVFPLTADSVKLEGDLFVPAGALGLVLLIHSGSPSHSRSQALTEHLHPFNLATLSIDLLTLHEEASDWHSKSLLFDVKLLSERLGGVTDWLMAQDMASGMRLGYFGVGVEAAVALFAAVAKPERVGAIACLGGRLDLASAVLPEIQVPTLLMVGDADSTLRVNQAGLTQIEAETRLEILPDATHLYPETATLIQAATLSGQWFQQHLPFHSPYSSPSILYA